MGSLRQRIPISLQGSTRKMEIFCLKAPMSGALGNGSDLTPKASFPDFGDFGPCKGPLKLIHWKQIYVSWYLGFLGMRHFQALSAILREQIGHSQALEQQNLALSGIFRGMILHDMPWFHLILHDPFGVQQPRNVSTEGKNGKANTILRTWISELSNDCPVFVQDIYLPKGQRQTPKVGDFCVSHNVWNFVPAPRTVSKMALHRGPPTIYRHHERLRIKKGISRGWCTNCQNLGEQQDVYHPQDCTGDVHHGFYGGGARIVGLDLQKCQCEFFSPSSGGNFFDVNFGRWISRGWIFEGALFIGKHRTKRFDPRIRPQNSGLKNAHPRIRLQIRVHEVQNPLCGNLALEELRFSWAFRDGNSDFFVGFCLLLP